MRASAQHEGDIMDKKYFLAIDIGASSGRHILGSIEEGKLVLEEIYRFKNGAEKVGDKLVWNDKSLISSIVVGLKKCKELNKIPTSIGIDTWGVDYALLDENDNLIGEVFSYGRKGKLCCTLQCRGGRQGYRNLRG
jgi:rhamnulokinase